MRSLQKNYAKMKSGNTNITAFTGFLSSHEKTP